MRKLLLLSVLLLSACDKPLSDKETIALMQHCVDKGLGIRLEFNAEGHIPLLTQRLSGVTCRAKYEDEP